MLCPFHPDKTPSLQIYPQTNTCCCFSSNCRAGTGDAIQFIQLQERCTKHEALLKATALLNRNGHINIAIPAAPPAAKLFIESSSLPLEKIAVLTKLFTYFTKALPLTSRAVDYLQGRAIDYKAHEVGYNSGDWHHKLKEKHFLKSGEQYGLLKVRAAGGYSTWAKDCVVFPLRNAEHKIVSLYGRSIVNDCDQRHFYLTNRSGLYPGYPSLTTRELILTESIIDAASLLQQQAIKEHYSILSLYGTNGLTEEHKAAITALPQLEEIILMLNADEAGESATQKHYRTLKALLPSIHFTHVSLPSSEDVNSMLQSHEDAGVLLHLIEERKEFFLSIEPCLPADRKEESAAIDLLPASVQQSRLYTQNPELLIYSNNDLYVEILGRLRVTGLDRMKVTLKVRPVEKLNHPQWYSLDLYHQVQREQMINSISETLELGTQPTAQAVIELITELETYRLQRIEALQPKEVKAYELTAAQKQAAIAELKKPNLLMRTSQLLQQCGLVGEETNSLIAYLIYGTRKQAVPLHVMFLGTSGSGKTICRNGSASWCRRKINWRSRRSRRTRCIILSSRN